MVQRRRPARSGSATGRDDVLDNVTLYWLTNTGVSSARLYWQNKLQFFAPKHVTIPVAVSVFPDEFASRAMTISRAALKSPAHET
jgi:hypothetical protein